MEETLIRELWVKKEHGRPQHLKVIGETSRSWLTGWSYRPHKWSKRDYKVITEDEAREYIWAEKNAYKIARSIYEYSLRVTPAQLREIAKIIGYVDAGL
jgi:hypothetical protein